MCLAPTILFLSHNAGRSNFQVRMANLAMVGSHTVNGVAAIHSELIKTSVFPNFYDLWPEKFQNKTNGITPRRWLNQANQGLSALISELLGTDEWLKDLDMLRGLQKHASDPTVQEQWMDIKYQNKVLCLPTMVVRDLIVNDATTETPCPLGESSFGA